MVYRIKNVKDHEEVYDTQGNFILSADNQAEALDDLLAEDADAVCA